MLRPSRAAASCLSLVALLLTACEPEDLKGPVAIYQGTPPKHGMLAIQFDPAAGGAPVVAGVIAGSPAAEAGISPGDVITSVDGRAVTSHQEVLKVLSDKAPGATVPVGLTHDGETLTLNVRLISFTDAAALQVKSERGRSTH